MKFLIFILSGFILTQEIQINKYEIALENIRNSKLVKSYFIDSISDSSQINFYVSDSIKYIDPQFFIDDIISHKLHRKAEGWQSKDSLYYKNEFEYIMEKMKKFEPYKIDYLKSLSNNEPYDLNISFFPYTKNIIIAEVVPYGTMFGFRSGISCIFFFDKNNEIIKNKYITWEN